MAISNLSRVPLDCPACDRAMPPVPVKTRTRTVGRELVLILSPDFTDEWRESARIEHGECMA